MTTMLRASGNKEAVQEFLAYTHWRPCATYLRGLPVRPSSSRISKVSGFNVQVSKAGRLSLASQVRSAQRFVANERRELRRMAKLGLHGVLDFGVASQPDSAASFYRFPESLLALLAGAALDLEVSYYGVER